MRPARLETFADGVFAIAATLLILNVDAQVTGGVGNLGDRLIHIWPSYLAYAVSFVTIGIMWVNHHWVMSQIDHTDRRFLFANIGLLLCIEIVDPAVGHALGQMEAVLSLHRAEGGRSSHSFSFLRSEIDLQIREHPI